MTFKYWVTFLTMAIITGCQHPTGQTSTVSAAQTCQQDLKFLPDFLLTNDTGAPNHFAQKGHEHFDKALQHALTQANTITQLPQCQGIIADYLRQWRPGHLGIVSLLPEDANTTIPVSGNNQLIVSDAPQLTILSSQTLLLTLPSFAWEYQAPIEALLNDNRTTFDSHPYWILDVRSNGGGSDSSYRQLLSRVLHNQSVSHGAEFLVTRANIKAQTDICVAQADNLGCQQFIEPVVSAMNQASNGDYVLPIGRHALRYHLSQANNVAPQRVAVLIDRQCASSCEEFLLDIRQGFNVKLVGRRSYGALDYSNMRPTILPSQAFELYYATSRSTRLPYLPVDVAGIPPDIYLPLASVQGFEQEVKATQHWLETGKFQPTDE
ncbi:hypothetical protein FJQ87_12805 [Shewanella sp. SNU WT4]|nr:hypothetical protein FJQ87_12805 [Shewanella sp. SNU WT4]